MSDGWIKWHGGDCPIKSDKTQYILRFANSIESASNGGEDWRWSHRNETYDIIAYRITEDHEPMAQPQTREELTAHIAALQKQLDDMPKPERRWYGDGATYTHPLANEITHYFYIEVINGVPCIHGIAMKDVAK